MQIYFENSDLMPHNLAITLPGSLEEVGHLADAYAQAPDAPARQYIPPTDLKILLSSRLVRPGESQMLYMIAPYWEGVYPFVCTYPGHWRRMYGALYVVNDLDAYLADPEKYLAEHNVPIRDPMLEHIRPRTEWKLEDLAPSVASLSMGRSFAQGKQMFQVAACVSCHKLNDAGVAIGPDLAQLDAKLGPGDILKEILAPSEKINEKFQSYAFQLTSGRVITGLVTAETPQAVTVVDNPLAKTEPVVIPTADIAERSRSAVSLMPNGLLDRLSYEEVLDLVAYISARGHEDNMLFQPEGEHEH